MGILRTYKGNYFTLGPIFNTALETGARLEKLSDFEFSVRFTTKGDHAGFSFFFQFWKFFFEFNVHDTRHWNYDADRFFLPGEKPEFTGYPHE